MPTENGGAARKDADPVLDERSLSELAAIIGQSRLRGVLLSARDELAQQRQQLNAAASAGDVPQLRKIAHTLLGTCAQIGALEAKALASFIVKDAVTLTDIQALMVDLDNALNFLDADLTARASRGT